MLGLDLTNVTENGGPVPAGNYSVVVDKAEVVKTKAGNGEMIKTQFRITDGQPQAGRVIFEQFNIKNPNPQAVQIGLGQLKGMLKAFGHRNPNRLESVTEMLGLRGQVSVKVDEGQNGYAPQNRVTAYRAIAGAEQAGTTAGTAAPAPNANPFG